MMRSLLVVALITLSSKVAASDCAMVEYYPNVLTPDATDVGDKGGIVVAQLAFEKRPATPAKTWKLGGKAPLLTSLAPGLEVYVPAQRAATLTLAGGDGKAMVSIKTGGKRTQPAMPAIKRVTFHETFSRHSSASTTVELAGDPPDGVVALVVYDKDGKPRSFGTVVKNAKQVQVFGRSDCGGPFKGTIESRTNDQITLAWVDAAGIVGKQTASIKVQ